MQELEIKSQDQIKELSKQSAADVKKANDEKAQAEAEAAKELKRSEDGHVQVVQGLGEQLKQLEGGKSEAEKSAADLEAQLKKHVESSGLSTKEHVERIKKQDGEIAALQVGGGMGHACGTHCA